MSAVFAILASALAVAVGVCLLPDDPYQRWQLLEGTIHTNLRWIYERCHFDPTPIDVAFIGPSRMGAGVNAPRLSEALAARGLPHEVVNFSLPEAGRNTNYVIAHELLEFKHPRLIVLGVVEKPSRFGHPAFKFVAPRGLIVDPGYLSDMNYFSDLIYLPYRQLMLFVAHCFPGWDGLHSTFEPADFAGESVDTTGDVILQNVRIKEREAAASPAELARGVRKLERTSHAPFLPTRFGSLEFGDERHYVALIAREAKAKGVNVMFLYLPYYSGRSNLQEGALYAKIGKIVDARWIGSHAEWYADYGHLTYIGAEHLTDWLVTPIAAAVAASAPESRPLHHDERASPQT